MNELEHIYGQVFFDDVEKTGRSASGVIVKLLVELIDPRSVLDLGCGTGYWLSQFKQYGVSSVRGIDGLHVTRSNLRIAPDEFVVCDLSQTMPPPQGKFDLAICLEVAEHLPECKALELVKFLSETADIVLFSAAIPYQGGTSHLNEQWPTFWHDLFRSVDFVPRDIIRPAIWNNADVAFWYRQNTYLYTSKNTQLDRIATMEKLYCGLPANTIAVHPAQLEKNAREESQVREELKRLSLENISLKRTLKRLPGMILVSLKQRLPLGKSG